MIEIPNTTLCCIDCINHELSIRAIEHCLRACGFEKAIFLTDREFDLEGIDVIEIPAISTKEQYSLFVLKELHKYINTDFVLMIQYDGFIINPAAWTPEFQKYDYIGAKWLIEKNFTVGNGGFSLRSKRLLQALTDEDIKIGSIRPADSDDALHASHEDVVICRLYRPFLEQKYGIKFAPEFLADRFSYEHSDPGDNHPFGFHGLFNMWRYIHPSFLIDFLNMLSPKTLQSTQLLELGINYHRLGRFKEAELVYQKILEVSPHHQEAFALLNQINYTQTMTRDRSKPLRKTPSSSKQKKVSIIIPVSLIPVHEYHSIVLNCLNAIEENAGYQNYEVIIIDNVMSGENARGVIRECQARGYKVIPYPFKFNRPKALNYAAKHAKGEYLLFLDCDTVPKANFLRSLVETLESEGRIKAVSPQMHPPIHEVSLYQKINNGYIFKNDSLMEDLNYIKTCDELSLCCLLVDKHVFHEVGGLDESYRFYGADKDLFLKISERGYKCFVDKNVFVFHHGGLAYLGFKDNEYPRSFDEIVFDRKWFVHNDNAFINNKKELLVIKLQSMGDAVMVTPTINALREKYPSHKITLVTYAGWKDIFEGSPYIDELIAVEGWDKSKPSSLFYEEVTSEYLKKKEWANVIQLNCLDFPAWYKRTGLHLRDFYAEIAGVYPLKDTRYFIPITDDHRNTINAILKQHKTICIHTKGGWDLKDWPRYKWLEFAEAIYGCYNSKVILVGGKGEEIESPYIINLNGKLGIKELAALFERADLFVGLDSGPMHTASAANAPIIALFGPTPATVTAPNSDIYITIQAPLSCEVPCHGNTCPNGIGCMDSSAVGTVLKATEKILNRKGIIREHWKGDEPAKIFFKDWEWHITTSRQSNQTEESNKPNKIGRNAPCPCGSGKKYKKCCGD
jgi:ADP-heptose:LPS heptosyltransferase/tetratricopeptide (TPR) repeat protein